jgi:hypothetical protein
MNQDKIIEELREEIRELNEFVNAVSVSEMFKTPKFNAILEAYKIPQGVATKTIMDICLILPTLKCNYAPVDQKKIDKASVIKAFLTSCRTGISLNPTAKNAYLIPRASKDKIAIDFMESYIGLKRKAYDCGIKIECEYVMSGEDEIKRHAIGIPTIPEIDFLADNINEKIQKYTFRKSDVIYFTTKATIIETGFVLEDTKIEIAVLIEKCLNEKKTTDGKRTWKTSIIKKHMEIKDGVHVSDNGRRTDAIEMLKARAIKYLCKTLPSERLNSVVNILNENENENESEPAQVGESVKHKKTILSLGTEIKPEPIMNENINEVQENIEEISKENEISLQANEGEDQTSNTLI